MHLAYVDESGNIGPIPAGTNTFTLGCVLVPAARWPDIFDEIVDFRRFLRDQLKVPVRAEIKANYLLRNGGPFRPLGLSEKARFRIYRGLMRLQDKLDLQTFAVVIRKDRMAANGNHTNPRDVAWEYLLQRLERFTVKGSTHVVLMHDEGEGPIVRALARKARRIGSAGSAFGTGHLRRPARLIIDDPVSRRSHESYLLQMADLAAYAAYRKLYPPPVKPVNIVPQNMWDELGAAKFGEVNKMSGGPPGIVSWPS